MDLVTLTALLVFAYVALAAIDGIWLHLCLLKLHRLPEAFGEHLVHTARAVLFPCILVLVLDGSRAGPAFLVGLGLVLVDFSLVAWDAAVETRSRNGLGGLSAFEASLHTVLQALHVAAVACALAARPAAAWWDPASLPPVGGRAAAIFQVVLIGGCLTALLHLLLAGPAIGRLLALRHREHGRT